MKRFIFLKEHLRMNQSNRKDNALRLLAFVLIALSLIYMFTIWNLTFHSDSAAANMLAREHLRTGQLLPETWYYGTGVMLIFYNLLIAPMSLFCNNQILLRDLSVAIVLLLTIFLLRYFSKRYAGGSFYLAVLCLFCSGTSGMILDMGFIQGAYLISLAENLLAIILLVGALSEELTIRSKPRFALLMLMIVYFTVFGTLNIAYQILPLWGSIALYFVFENWHTDDPVTPQKLLPIVKLSACILIASAIGLIGCHAINTLTGFQSQTNIVYADNGGLANAFVKFFLSAIGYQTNVRLFSLAGLMNAVIVAVNALAVVCCVCLFRRYHEQPFAIKLLMNYSLLIFALFLYFDFFHYCVSTEGGERYLFKPLIFLYILAAYYGYTYLYKCEGMSSVVFLAGLMVFSLPCMLAELPNVAAYPASREQQLGLVHFLEEHDLTHGYASFWNAGKNMVLSDFQVEIGGVILNDRISEYHWLSSAMTYDPEFYSGNSFLLLTPDENAFFQGSIAQKFLGEPQETLNYEEYTIYVYPYNISQNSFSGTGYDDVELIDAMLVSDQTMITGQGISIASGQLIYGPYIDMSPGNYQLTFEFAEKSGEDISVRLTSAYGTEVLAETQLSGSDGMVIFTLDEYQQAFETVLSTEGNAILTSVKLTQS